MLEFKQNFIWMQVTQSAMRKIKLFLKIPATIECFEWKCC